MTDHCVPRVSVVMAVFDGEHYLGEAIESILGQTLGEFELIIVDDASTDSTPEILAAYARRDSRICVLRNETNLGPYPSGNRGLNIARAQIIARLDSDDVAAPRWLEREVGFLEANPDHLFVASSYMAIDGVGRRLYVKQKAADDFAVRWLMRFRMCVRHPGTCFRSTLPDGTPIRYDETFPVAQDFELLSRILDYGKAVVLPDVLLHYRIHPSNISHTRLSQQRSNALRISRRNLERELPSELAAGLDGLFRCYLFEEPATPALIRDTFRAFDRMLARDIAANPGASEWLRRQSAGMLAEAFLRRGRGFRDPRALAAFVIHGFPHLWPLVWRLLEVKGVLPGWLESYPDPTKANMAERRKPEADDPAKIERSAK